MNKLKIVLILFIFSLISKEIIFAQENSIFDLPVSARAEGIGNAYLSISDDASGVWWNPAGLSKIKEPTFTSMQSSLFWDRKQNFVSFAIPIGDRMGFGLGWVQFTIDDIEIFGNQGFLGITSDKENVYILSYAYGPLGISFKKISQKVYGYSAKGTAFDIGTFLVKNRKLNIAFKLQQGFKLKWNTPSRREDKIESVYIAGISFRPIDKLLIAGDFKNSKRKSGTFHAGLEYLLINQVALRCGYDDKDLTAGIGLKIFPFQIDYAYHTSDVGDIQKISLSYNFGKKAVKDKIVETPVKQIEQKVEAKEEIKEQVKQVEKKEEEEVYEEEIISKKEEFKERLPEEKPEPKEIEEEQKVEIAEKEKEEVKPIEKIKEEIVEKLQKPEETKKEEKVEIVEKPKEKIKEDFVSVSQEEFLCPFCDKRLLKKENLIYKTKEELMLMRNEIVARHGYIFKSKKLSEYFKSKSWYKENPDFSNDLLNEIEKSNVKIIREYEKIVLNNDRLYD